MTIEMTLNDAKRVLGEFLVDNRELEAVNARLGEFNLFQTLRIENAEIRHSNVLGWLLDPGESHGLGDHFLRRFLSRLLLANDSVEVPFSAAETELMNLNAVTVRREWHNIDVLVHDIANNWCLLIENKIGARESGGQLTRYEESVRRSIPGVALIPVYLTLAGDDPSDDAKGRGYIGIGYDEVLEVAQPAIEQHASRIPRDAAMFLEHYIRILRRLTMRDEELVSLCKTIYRRHRKAIDLIVEYGAASHVIDTCEQVIQEQSDPEFVLSRPNDVWFLPKTMASRMPIVPPSWTFLPRPYPILCWIRHKKKQGKLALGMELGPIHDFELRRKILDALKSGGFSFWEKGAYREEAKFTRFLTMSRSMTPEGGDEEPDEEAVRRAAEGLWKKFWDQGEAVLGVLASIQWPKS